MNAMVIAILAYVLLQLGVGAVVSWRIRTETDYILAGRRLGYLLATFSLFATWFGAETCIGSAGEIAQHGLSAGAADPFGYALCLLLMGLFLARPLWKLKLTTIGDLFRLRFGAGVERVVVLLMVPTSVLWAAAQVRACGQVLAAAGEWQIVTTTTIAAAVVIVYTMLGGLLADAWTDLVQGIVLVLGLVLLLVLMGADGSLQKLSQVDPAMLNPFHRAESGWLGLVEAWALPVCGSLVAAEMISRVIAARSPRVAVGSSLMATGMYLVVGLIPVIIGLLAKPVLGQLPDGEHVLHDMAERYMPGALYVVFAGALVSAILSTVDSALLVAGSLVSHNLVLPLAPGMGERAKVWTARSFVALFGVVAYVLALSAEGVYELVKEASGFGSAGIFVVTLAALFTRAGRSIAAIASLLAGVGVWIVSAYALPNIEPAHGKVVFATLINYPYLSSLAAAVVAYLLPWPSSRRGIGACA
jgi:Na+/proline symporter